MSWRARILSWTGAVELALTAAATLRLAAAPSLGGLLLLFGTVYLLPPALFRAHQLLWPLREGTSRLDGPDYVPWWGAHQIQGLYNSFPALEAALRLVPGLYSAWLRLWGARIGRHVHWTARVEILDRSLLEVGDGVLFGHKAACYAHVIAPKGGRLLLYVRRVSIGAHAFIGAGSRLGPGARIAEGAVLPVCTDVSIDTAFEAVEAS